MKSKTLKFALYLVALIWLVLMVYPLFYGIQTSLKSQQEYLISSPLSMPTKARFGNYFTVLKEGFYRYFFNSVIVAFFSVVFILLSSSMAGFAFAKREFRFRRIIFFLFMAGLYVPIHVTLIPTYVITKGIGLYDTIWGLIGPYVAVNLPLGIIIMTRFMSEIPDDLIDAAKIDGSSWLQTYWRVALPLTRPALATVGIYASVWIWNEFVYALVLLSSETNRTLPLGLWRFQGKWTINVPLIMTAVVLTVLPLLVIYIFFSERIIKGLVAGAVD